MAGLILGCIIAVIFGTFGLMFISEKYEMPLVRGKRREVVYDEAIDDDIKDIINKIDWSKIESNKTYELALALGDIEDDFDWGEFI